MQKNRITKKFEKKIDDQNAKAKHPGVQKIEAKSLGGEMAEAKNTRGQKSR